MLPLSPQLLRAQTFLFIALPTNCHQPSLQ